MIATGSHIDLQSLRYAPRNDKWDRLLDKLEFYELMLYVLFLFRQEKNEKKRNGAKSETQDEGRKNVHNALLRRDKRRKIYVRI